MIKNFAPAQGLSVIVAGTVVAASTQFTTGDSFRYYNAGPDLAYMRIGTGDATAADMAIPMGAIEVFQRGNAAISILSVGTSTVYLTPGSGS